MRYLKMSSLPLTCALVASVCFAADAVDSSTCHAPPAAPEPTSVVETTDYTAQAEATPDPKAIAAKNAWDDYQSSVYERLKTSPEPRDWALASALMLYDSKRVDERKSLITHAASAAPDDALVQIVAMNQSYLLDAKTTDDVLARAELLEPDNAAVWLAALNRAHDQTNEAGVATALSKMATSTRFDTRLIELMKMSKKAFEQAPTPDVATILTDPNASGFRVDLLPYVQGVSLSVAVANPPLQRLMTACRLDESENNTSRAADCAQAGRLLISKSETYLMVRVGFAMLRTSHTQTTEDEQNARELDWIYSRHVSVANSYPGFSPDEFLSFNTDWMETGSEIGAMRRSAARKGDALTPPESWVDAQSPFSKERFEQDAVRLKERAKAN